MAGKASEGDDVKGYVGPVLRHVEKDVLIPKLVERSAMEKCTDEIYAFEQCCSGRTMSMFWKCRAVKNAMQECIRSHCTPADFQRTTDQFITEKLENVEQFKPDTSS